MEQEVSEMSDFRLEKSEMSSVEFAQFALRERIAPRPLGSVKERLRHAARIMSRRGWSANRVRDCWYADERISPNADEIRDVEEITGLEYGRAELRTTDDLIARADALLAGPEADFYRPFVDAFRAMARAFDRTRTEG
jgi:hypothetical protein